MFKEVCGASAFMDTGLWHHFQRTFMVWLWLYLTKPHPCDRSSSCLKSTLLIFSLLVRVPLSSLEPPCSTHFLYPSRNLESLIQKSKQFPSSCLHGAGQCSTWSADVGRKAHCVFSSCNISVHNMLLYVANYQLCASLCQCCITSLIWTPVVKKSLY